MKIGQDLPSIAGLFRNFWDQIEGQIGEYWGSPFYRGAFASIRSVNRPSETHNCPRYDRNCETFSKLLEPNLTIIWIMQIDRQIGEFYGLTLLEGCIRFTQGLSSVQWDKNCPTYKSTYANKCGIFLELFEPNLTIFSTVQIDEQIGEFWEFALLHECIRFNQGRWSVQRDKNWVRYRHNCGTFSNLLAENLTILWIMQMCGAYSWIVGACLSRGVHSLQSETSIGAVGQELTNITTIARLLRNFWNKNLTILWTMQVEGQIGEF